MLAPRHATDAVAETRNEIERDCCLLLLLCDLLCCLLVWFRYNMRQEVLRRVPGLVGLEVEAAGALPVTEKDIQLLHFWAPFADHAYDANVRPWLDTQEGWVLLHQVGA